MTTEQDTTEKPIEILLVEDNEGDIFLTQKAFAQAKIKNTITVATDGEMAMNMLMQKGKYKTITLPDLILLDLNLPKKDGQQVLAEIKAEPTLKRIPVVMLTSSKADQDIAKAYDLHANSYIVKPINLENFHEIVQTIENFWFKIVTLPTQKS